MTDIAAQLSAVDRATMTRLVRRALRSAVAEVIDWVYAPLAYAAVNPASVGLYRFAGAARIRGTARPWSMVLKIARPLDAGHDPAHFLSPLREVRAYQSGLFDALADGLAAPRCYGTIEQPDGSVWLWLEEIVDRYGGRWPLARYGLAARHLGRFNGAYLAGRPLPSYPWLTRGTASLRAWVTWVAELTQALPLLQRSDTWEHPLVRRAFPVSIADRLRRLLEERERFLDVLERLPPTLCHRDADCANLLTRRRDGQEEETVAIDWAFAGIGALGEEIGVLVYGTLLRHAVAMGDAEQLEALVLDGYLAGLRDTGWRGDPLAVRCGYAAAAVLRGGLIAPGLRLVTLDAGGRAAEERRWGRPLEAILEQRAALTAFLLCRADEVRKLAPRL
jgi:hypothetical protein